MPRGAETSWDADLAAVAEELYALDPAAFTAARDRRAAEFRQAGDRATASAIKAWKRASPPAWAVNLLARERAGELAQFLELGEQLRQAQARLSAQDLRSLSRQRQAVLGALARTARDLASERSRPVSDAAARQVEETLGAALADADAAAAVASGRLVRALLHSGIGPVDVEGAVAGPVVPAWQAAAAVGATAAADGAAAEVDPAALGQLELELAAAEEALDAASASEAQAESEVADAEQRRTEAEAEVARLQEELTSARRAADEAREAVREAKRRQEAAGLDTKAARRHATAVRTELEEVRGGVRR